MHGFVVAVIKAAGLTGVVAWSLFQFWRQSAWTASGCHTPMVEGGGGFVDVRMSGDESHLALKYRLTRYQLHSDISQRDEGRLVLMIPGHCGGHRQFTKIADMLSRNNTTVYAIDHGGEYSGFHGLSLLEEAEFAVDAVNYIRGTSDKPVTVMGHSMGGMAAMAMTLMEGYKNGTVNKIVTFATSHTKPPISLDPRLDTVYKQLAKVFPQTGVQLISVVNSHRDLMVDPAMSITKYGKNIDIQQQFDCRPDHISILYCGCVVDNIEQIINGDTLPISRHHDHQDWFAGMFRQFGVMIIAIGVQLYLLVHIASIVDGGLTHFAYLNYKVIIGFGVLYTVYGYFMHSILTLGLWAIACLGPNYIFITALTSLGTFLRSKIATFYGKDAQSTSTFNALLTLSLTVLFAPFPYAILIINLTIAFHLLRHDINQSTAPLTVFAYLQIMNSPSLLVWVKGVSRGWVSFGDIDVIRAIPLALFAFCLKTGLFGDRKFGKTEGKVHLLATILLLLTVTWFSEKETFRIGDAFAIYLLTLTILTLCSRSKFTAKDGVGALDGVKEGMSGAC